MKEGTLNGMSVPVATIPSQTASGVGTVGGNVGLNVATMSPATGYHMNGHGNKSNNKGLIRG